MCTCVCPCVRPECGPRGSAGARSHRTGSQPLDPPRLLLPARCMGRHRLSSLLFLPREQAGRRGNTGMEGHGSPGETFMRKNGLFRSTASLGTTRWWPLSYRAERRHLLNGRDAGPHPAHILLLSEAIHLLSPLLESCLSPRTGSNSGFKESLETPGRWVLGSIGGYVSLPSVAV